MPNDVVIRELMGYRPARPGEWGPSGLVAEYRYHQVTPSEYQDLLTKSEQAMQDASEAEDFEGLTQAAAIHDQLGSRAVVAGVLPQFLNAWQLSKGRISETGEPVTLAGRIHAARGDFAAWRAARVAKSPDAFARITTRLRAMNRERDDLQKSRARCDWEHCEVCGGDPA